MSQIICLKCKGSPCICHYVERLGSGALGLEITHLAVARMQEPHGPIRSCPCPGCYRVRYSTWEVAR